MAYLNKELQRRLDKLTPVNKNLLENLLLDLSEASTTSEKKDAIETLRAKVRELVVAGEHK